MGIYRSKLCQVIKRKQFLFWSTVFSSMPFGLCNVPAAFQSVMNTCWAVFVLQTFLLLGRCYLSGYRLSGQRWFENETKGVCLVPGTVSISLSFAELKVGGLEVWTCSGHQGLAGADHHWPAKTSRGTGKSARAQGIGAGTVKNGAVIRIPQFCNGANTGRLASTLKSVTYFCKNCQFWKNPWGYCLKSSVNECIIMYSALMHKQYVAYLSVEFMRTCPDEQPMSRRQFIHGKEPY